MRLARFSVLKKLHLQSEVSLINNLNMDIKRSNIITLQQKGIYQHSMPTPSQARRSIVSRVLLGSDKTDIVD